jgi:biotin synthase-related radical SAM superfamily protein
MITAFKATVSAARRRRIVRDAHRAYRSIEAALSDVEFFEREVLVDALSALGRVPSALVTASCTDCDHHGYRSCELAGCPGGHSAHGCPHDGVPAYTTREGVA